MSSAFDVVIESALVLTGPLLALDESTLVGVTGNTLRVIDGPSGAAFMPPPPTGADGCTGGFTAVTTVPALGVVAQMGAERVHVRRRRALCARARLCRRAPLLHRRLAARPAARRARL